MDKLNFEYYVNENDYIIKVKIKNFMEYTRYFVPINYSLKTKKFWLTGLIDGCAKDEDDYISISLNSEILKNCMYLLRTLGISSSYIHSYKLYIKKSDLNKLNIKTLNFGNFKEYPYKHEPFTIKINNIFEQEQPQECYFIQKL